MNFIGTTDNEAVEIHADSLRVARFEPAIGNSSANTAPNVIEGDAGNIASTGVQGGTISGGGGLSGTALDSNTCQADFATVSGGIANSARGQRAVVGSGFGNIAGGAEAVISGGHTNAASNLQAVVAGGANNVASGTDATVSGGSHNSDSGINSVVVGGANNVASGNSSFAGGSGAQAASSGVFIWADSNGQAFSSEAINEFAARSTGGVRFVTAIDGDSNPTAGVTVAAGSGSWTSLSDRSAKSNVEPVDSQGDGEADCRAADGALEPPSYSRSADCARAEVFEDKTARLRLVLRRRARGFACRIDEVLANMILDDLGHQAVEGAARRHHHLENRAAPLRLAVAQMFGRADRRRAACYRWRAA